MNRAEGPHCYILPGIPGQDGAEDAQGPVLTLAENTHRFTILDCFDQSLRQSGRLLLETDGMFELRTDAGDRLSQSAQRERPFVADFAPGPVRDALADLSPLRALLPIGEGDLRLGTLALLDDEGKTRARALLQVFDTGAGAPVVLALPQGLRGYDRSLRQLHAYLRALGGLAEEEGNLYRQLFPASHAYVARPEIRIGPDASAFDTASDIIDGHIPVMRANEAGIIADHDTEFLHDYRVALRKIRSVLSLFRDVYDPVQTAELKVRFSALMAPTGRLRDLDVYLLERESFYRLVPESLHAGLDRLFTMIGEEREEARARLARHLQSSAYDKDIRALTKLFEKRRKLLAGPNAARKSHGFACMLIWKRYRRICKAAALLGPASPDAEVHALRIDCKKLRYLMEFFAPAFPKAEISALLRPLKRLQDGLGLFNDLAVQQESLQQFVNELGSSVGDRHLDVAQSVGALIAVLHQRQEEERAKLHGALDQFTDAGTGAAFADLFHPGKEHP